MHPNLCAHVSSFTFLLTARFETKKIKEKNQSAAYNENNNLRRPHTIV